MIDKTDIEAPKLTTSPDSVVELGTREKATSIENSPYAEEQLSNAYLDKIQDEIMSEYSKIGVVRFLELVNPDDGPDKFWESYYSSPDINKQGKDLTCNPKYSEDGSEIVGYNIYEIDKSILEQKKAEVESIAEKSDNLIDAKFEAVESAKTNLFEAATSSGEYIDLGELSIDQYTKWRSGNLEMLMSGKVEKVFVFDMNGNVDRSKIRVFVRK